MTWPGFPKRLQSALKALCCLARSNDAMQSHVIAGQIAVPKAETAKILQLLVWGGFVTSRRGTKGGFHLAAPADRITMGEVIDFFLARHPVEADGSFPVIRALEQSMAPCQQTFARLTLMDVCQFRAGKVTCGKEPPKKAQRHLSLTVSSARTHKKRSNANVLHRA